MDFKINFHSENVVIFFIWLYELMVTCIHFHSYMVFTNEVNHYLGTEMLEPLHDYLHHSTIRIEHALDLFN